MVMRLYYTSLLVICVGKYGALVTKKGVWV